jgi:hypothetical protein
LVCHAELPNGRPRAIERRIASSSASFCGWLTCSHYSRPSFTGDSASSVKN